MMITKKQVSKSATIRTSDLLSPIENWQQAATKFYNLYKILMQTIAVREQVERLSTYKGTLPLRQYSSCELEQLRKAMFDELHQLVNDMNELSCFDQDIERLHSHTLKLQQQAKRIQRALVLSSLNAS
ncbi:hypothetical protein G8759_00330 [Spirosoma aureum]|uniref:Uncharacterized protein n=1 Tax=Spirosoma aureum TaxID=2692134 RepID=A0A6G9AFV7_9BACT|nr:hypothetical protein [Spirosoma aureum]QIP11196.1 hypothetical protein G8759_00330 [Spirosoma aureum]